MKFAKYGILLVLALTLTSCGLFTPRAKMFEVKMSENNQIIELQLRQRFKLDLDDQYTWNVVIGNRTVLKQVVDVQTIENLEGVYEGIAVGESVITANGEPKCLKDAIPCALRDRAFKITVRVQ